MCRLFGFRSIIKSQVHSSLVDAENALGVQSNDHPDGWGVAYYVQNCPHVVKSAKAAIGDAIFKKISGVVSSETVLAHIRKTTVGKNNILNTHPFQYGSWVFAHNGNITDYQEKRADILAEISPTFKRFILGDTDSEVIFYFLLSFLNQHHDLSSPDIDADLFAKDLKRAIEKLISIAGPPATTDNCGVDATYYTFIITNGRIMIGHHGGKNLHYSTYKSRCSERETCPSYSAECEAATKTGAINHLLFSSEPLIGENIWHGLELGEMAIVNKDMQFKLIKS